MTLSGQYLTHWPKRRIAFDRSSLRPARRAVTVRCYNEHEYEVLTDGLSFEHMSVVSDVPVVLEETVDVVIDAGGRTHHLDVQARVTHVRSLGDGQYHVGLSFLRMTPKRVFDLEEMIGGLMGVQVHLDEFRLSR